MEKEFENDLYLVNETETWSFKLNPTVGGVSYLGAGKRVKLRSEAERIIAANLCRKFSNKMSIKRIADKEATKVIMEDVTSEVSSDIIEEKEVSIPEIQEIADPVIEQTEEKEHEPVEPVTEQVEETVEQDLVEEPEESEKEEDAITEPPCDAPEEETEEIKLSESPKINELPELTDVYDSGEEETTSNIGKIFTTDVSGKTVEVEIIDEEEKDDGTFLYKAINLSTGRKITIDTSKKTLTPVEKQNKEEMKLSDI